MPEEFDKQSTDVLLNTFTINRKRYHVLLHNNKIVCKKENSNEEKAVIPLNDIITVKLKRSKIQSRNFSNIFTGNNQNESSYDININTNPNISSNNERNYLYFTIYYGKRLENSRKNYNQWRKNSITLYNNDCNVIKLWYDTIIKFLTLQKRPKCILMFINPFGGKKQALQIYEKFSKPLMNLAGIDVNCIVSQRHNQIRDIIMAQSLDIYDAICCVGGDGTFAEVFNGLLFRTIRDLNMDMYHPKYIPKPKIPIGIIPAGSTNTVAYCMHGTTDVRTAVIHIILGQTRGLDLSSFCNNNGLVRFYASVMSYGYLGDVALESEKFRWMGPKRYDYTGFKKLLLNDGYEGEITYLLSSDENDFSKTKCSMDCVRCLSVQKGSSDNENDTFDNCNKSYLKETQKNYEKSELPIGNILTRKLNENEWKNIKGKFFMINSANITCASSRSLNGLSPFCHLGDGYIDVVLVRHTNIINNIRLLLTLVNRKGNIANLPFVEIYRTRKFFFRTQKPNEDISLHGSCQPIDTIKDNLKTSQWNCDGEVIHDTDIYIRSHCQLIDVFMRGPNFQNNENKTAHCFKFCNQ